jgi:NADH-quinone oxidoreductase subunit C
MSGIQPSEYQEIQDWVVATTHYAGETTIEVKAAAIVQVCEILKGKFGFDYLADITAIDYYTDEARFGVAYNLASIEGKKRLRILARLPEHEPTIATVIKVWPAANWFERECWDMMGIRFQGHPDLRRIYMPEDFEYFPLRKEFPLIGIPGSIQVPQPDGPKEYK